MKNLKTQFKAVMRPVSRGNLVKLIEEWGYLEEDEIAFLRNSRLTKTEAVSRLANLICSDEVNTDVFNWH